MHTAKHGKKEVATYQIIDLTNNRNSHSPWPWMYVQGHPRSKQWSAKKVQYELAYTHLQSDIKQISGICLSRNF